MMQCKSSQVTLAEKSTFESPPSIDNGEEVLNARILMFKHLFDELGFAEKGRGLRRWL